MRMPRWSVSTLLCRKVYRYAVPCFAVGIPQVGRRLRCFGELLFSLNLWTSNARGELLPKAGATEERTLEAVGSTALFK
jgi:hypothetical protein